MRRPREKQQKIKNLLESREKVLKGIKKLDEVFKEEKENEDFWPGHESTKYQAADNDYQVLLDQLALINKELESLGVEIQDAGKEK